MLYTKSKNGTTKPCSLDSIKYDFTVQDTVLNKKITQVFSNKNKKSVEMEYKFGTDETTTVFNVRVELYDQTKDETRVLLAKVFEKEEAQERYDDAIASGQTAMLAESDEDDSVSLTIGQVKAGIRVTIIMNCVQELEMEKSELKDQFNMKVLIPSLNMSGKEYSIGSVEKNVEVALSIGLENGKIVELYSDSHRASFTAEFEEKGGRIFSTKKLSYRKDITINVGVKDVEEISAVVEKREDEKKSSYTTIVSFCPTLKLDDSSINSELVIIVDCSGSMSGRRMNSAVSAMEKFLETLKYKTQNIKINIVRFGSRYESLYPSPKKLTKKNYNEVSAYISQTNSTLGGTNILNPIKGVLKESVSEGYTRQVFLLTDGEDGNTEEIIKYVRKYSDTTRFFTFGIGGGINPMLINRVASASNGRAVFIAGYGEPIEDKVIEQLNHAIQPALTNIKIQFPKGCKGTSVLEHIPACYNNSKVSQYFFSNKRPSEVNIMYSIGNKKKGKTIKTVDVRNELSVLAARKKVLELEKYDETKEKEKKIKELGLKYNFLTTQTSFLMVDEDDDMDAIQDEMISEKIETVQKRKEPENSYQSNYNSNYNSNNNYSSYNNYSHTRCRRRGFNVSIPNPFSIGGCIGTDSIVTIKDTLDEDEEEINCPLRDVEEGQYVMSVSKKGKREFSKVIELAHHETKRKAFRISCEKEGKMFKVVLTGCHLIPVAREKDAKFTKKMKYMKGKEVKVGDYIFLSDLSIATVTKVEECIVDVTCVFTDNGQIICNGIVCSVHVSTQLVKGVYYYKKAYHNLVPKKLHNKLSRKLFHYIFVKEKVML